MENDELSADLTDSWPAGHRPGNKATSRFNVPRQNYFNLMHMFFPDDFTNLRPHTKADLKDIQVHFGLKLAYFVCNTIFCVQTVIEAIVGKVSYENPNKYQYRRLVNGYRTFDLSRGLDYKIDLAFRDLTTGKEVIKR